GVVLAELVLAVVERLDDRVELLLRALVAAEVVLDLAAERDEAEELLADARLARVEVLDRAAQLQQRLAHLRAVGDAALAQLLDRHLEHAVGDVGRRADVLVAHLPDVVRLGGELGGARVRRQELVEVRRHLRLQARDRRLVDARRERRGLRGGDGLDGLRGAERERLGRGGGLERCCLGHVGPSLVRAVVRRRWLVGPPSRAPLDPGEPGGTGLRRSGEYIYDGWPDLYPFRGPGG